MIENLKHLHILYSAQLTKLDPRFFWLIVFGLRKKQKRWVEKNNGMVSNCLNYLVQENV